jgi:hypothetical protein
MQKFNELHAIIKALHKTKGICVIQSPSILQAIHSHNFKPMIIRNNDYIICRKLRIFLLSVCGNKKTQDNQYLVLQPTISTQVFLGFPVSVSKC